MKRLGLVPVIEVPKVDFGYLQIPERAGQTFMEAFREQFEGLGDLLEKSVSGHCKFDKEGVLEGSNPFVLSLIREGDIVQDGEFLYSPKDFARTFNENPEIFQGFYQDLGFAVAISPDQAKQRGSQIKRLAQNVYDAGFKSAGPNNPIFVPHTAIAPVEIDGSHIFGITNQDGLVEAQAYANNNPTKNFDTYDAKTAIPIPTEDGSNRIYTVQESPGVFRVCSGDGQSAYAYNDDLAYSGSSGRVPVGSVIPQEYIEASREVRQAEKQIAEIKKNLERKVASL